MLFRNEKKDERDPSSGPVRVPLLPLRDIIVFPHMVVPLFVGRQRSIKALEEATQKQSLIFLSSQKDAKTNDPSEEDIYKIGTLGSVVQMLKLPDGTVKVLIEGKRRARVARFISNADFFLVDVEEAAEVVERNTEVEALVREVHTTFENYVKLKKKNSPGNGDVGLFHR
jgi:ATP-dependent Lon protease